MITREVVLYAKGTLNGFLVHSNGVGEGGLPRTISGFEGGIDILPTLLGRKVPGTHAGSFFGNWPVGVTNNLWTITLAREGESKGPGQSYLLRWESVKNHYTGDTSIHRSRVRETEALAWCSRALEVAKGLSGCFSALPGLLEEVWAERIRQVELWGAQSYPVCDESDRAATHLGTLRYWRDVAEKNAEKGENCWDAILLEEVYEALSEPNPTLARKELIQVAATALAMAEDMETKGGAK